MHAASRDTGERLPGGPERLEGSDVGGALDDGAVEHEPSGPASGADGSHPTPTVRGRFARVAG